jgi:hypothetical protein
VVYNTQNYWGSGLYPLSEFKILENTIFWKLGLFLSSGEGWEKSTPLGSLEGANLNH